MKSRGLMNKTTIGKTIIKTCSKCDGSGIKTIANLQASAIKNLTVSGSITLQDDCPNCNGSGNVQSVIRLVRRRINNGSEN